MHTNEELVRFSQAVIGAFLLWFGYWLLVRRFLLERYRQDLFAIRDELFDKVAQFPGGFNDLAYKQLRQMINGLIRYADRTGPVYILSMWLVGFFAAAESELPGCGSISPELAPVLKRARRKAINRLKQYVFWEHLPLGPIILLVLWLRSTLRYGPRKSKPVVLTRPFRIFQSEAFRWGANPFHNNQLATQ